MIVRAFVVVLMPLTVICVNRQAKICVAVPLPAMSRLTSATSALASYYTLAAAGIPLTDLPEHLVKKLPRYPSVPVAVLGRLAVDTAFQGKGIGSGLLGNAIQRALYSEIAVAALVVIAKDEQAEAFYRHHNFLNFGSLPRQLILHLSAYRSFM